MKIGEKVADLPLFFPLHYFFLASFFTNGSSSGLESKTELHFLFFMFPCLSEEESFFEAKNLNLSSVLAVKKTVFFLSCLS